MADIGPIFNSQPLSTEPPERPWQPSPPNKSKRGKALKELIGATMSLGLSGLVVGGILGVIFSGLATGRTLEARYAAQESALYTTIILGVIIGALIGFCMTINDVLAERAQDRSVAEEYRRNMDFFQQRMRKYQEDMAIWPKELERRKAHNANIHQARAKLYAEQEAARLRKAERQEAQRQWENKAQEAHQLFLRWRVEFIAECIAIYGPRAPDEIDRLCKEAFPYAPISADYRLGYLHRFAGSTPEIAQIKHLLPKEIPFP